VRDHGQITGARIAAVNVAVAPAHRAERGTQVGPRGVQNRFAKSQPARGIADQRRKNIVFSQAHARRRAQGLLAATQKNAAVDFAGAVKRGKLVVQQPRPQHEAESGQMRLADGIGYFSPRLGNGLQHGASLSRRALASNDSFSGRFEIL
jgi:hypothetical protein